jgi:TrmH family RNA methyltransferase
MRGPQPLGAHSPKLDAVRALRTKAGRRERARFSIEGPTLLEEALSSGVPIEALYATEDGYAKIGRLAERIDVPVYMIPDRAMARISDLETPPGSLAVVPAVLAPLEKLLGEGEPVLLIAGVGDPGNAGTLLRSAEIFGIRGVIFGTDGVEPHNPKVVRGSMGAIFRLSIAVAGAEEVRAAAGHEGYALLATSREGTPIGQMRFSRRSIVAVGNERRGVAAWLPSWDGAVSIPQRGRGESLNAAVAGSIIIHALMQQLDDKILPDSNREKP